MVHVSLGTIADSWGSSSSRHCFRLCLRKNPEEVDQILCGGAKRDRAGSHAAIERILKHEPGFRASRALAAYTATQECAARVAYRRSVCTQRNEGSCVTVMAGHVRETKQQNGNRQTT